VRFTFFLAVVVGFLIAVTTAKAEPPPPCNGTLQRNLCEAIRRHTTHPEWANSRSLAKIVKHESGGILCAVNPGRIDCSYSGNHACGFFQLLPCRCFPNVVKQARCGVAYIAGRYGHPDRALVFWKRNGWY